MTGIDFAVGIDQTQTYSWKVTQIRTDFGPPFLASSLAFDGRAMAAFRPKPRTRGSAAHRRYMRRIAKWNAQRLANGGVK